MNNNDHALQAFTELTELVAIGPRFHGTPQILEAERLLTTWLTDAGADVYRQEVRTPGWNPGATSSLEILLPTQRTITAWPMLWSGGTRTPSRAVLKPVGLQGLWGDSMTWTKFAAVHPDHPTKVIAYVHARDGGPAAPQPLPIGSNTEVPHVAIGRIDGLAIAEWIADGHEVKVNISCEAAHVGEAVSNNLFVDIPARPGGALGKIMITGHYDSFFNTPGAYDNGSGTIALVHLVRRLVKNRPNRPVTVMLTTAEEWHLAGSRHFVDTLDEQQCAELDFVLNIDGLGRGEFMEVFAGPETFENTFLGELQDYAKTERPGLEIQSRFPPTCGTDQGAFYSAGIPVAFFTFNDLHLLHQPNDMPTAQSAANIAWTVPLITHLIEVLPRADRLPNRTMKIPF